MTELDITDFKDGFEAYASSQLPRLYKWGKVVTLNGAIKNTVEVTSSATSVVMCTIPEGYRPRQNIYVLCQGSNLNKFLLNVFANGNVAISRYGIDSYVNLGTGTWITLNAVWICA